MGSYGQEFGSEMRFRDTVLEILEFEYFPFASFGFDPGFEQLSSCSEHISDPKGANGKFMNSALPLLGSTSAENPGAHDLSRYLKANLSLAKLNKAYVMH